METVDAAVAGAQFEMLLDKVEHDGDFIIIVRDGRPVARIERYERTYDDPIFGLLKDQGRIVGDIDAPIHTDEEYEEFLERKAAMFEAAAIAK